MKARKLAAFLMSIVCVTMLLVPALAAENRASDQIKQYGMTVTPGSGTLDVEFTITGTNSMNKIGCESIYVYKKVGTSWVYVTSRDEDDEGMSRTNFVTHQNMISIPCTAGIQYKVEVTVFAENSAGRDTRSKTFFLTGT